MEPVLVRARLSKMTTDDGLLSVIDARAGDIVIVDLSTRTTTVLLNKQYNVMHEKDLIQSAEDGGWFPCECLELIA